MSGPTSATFEDSDEDLVHGPVTRSRGKLFENLGSLISLSKRSVTFADSKERKSRTSTKGGKKRQLGLDKNGPEVQVALPLRLYRKSFARWAQFPKDSKVNVSLQKARIKIKIRLQISLRITLQLKVKIYASTKAAGNVNVFALLIFAILQQFRCYLIAG